METLDAELAGRSVSILKLDVEGAEQAVLDGAASTIKDKRLRHIIFEEHHGAGSPVMAHVLGHGYTIFSVEWTLMGPRLGDAATLSAHARYEAPSYLATLTPDAARAACSGRGWMALGGSSRLRSRTATHRR